MSTWKDWNRTTRFFKSTFLALEREAALCRSLPFEDPSSIEFCCSIGNGRYRVSLDKHVDAVSDTAMLCALVLVFAYATTEEAARARLIPPLGSNEPIEQWALRLLQSNGAAWSARFGCGSLVEVAVARNAVAHDLTIDQHMINRIQQYGGVSPWAVGDRVVLTLSAVEEYRARLRSLLRYSGIK